MNGLTCNGFATKSESGLKTNVTLSPHGVFVTSAMHFFKLLEDPSPS
uniref:Uncharacterized protein n=1 Tax=Rhizophora mucronata TaxID=61149 RepID=A0A2P2ITE2_RHIMU